MPHSFAHNTAHNLAIAYQLHLKTNNLPSQSLLLQCPCKGYPHYLQGKPLFVASTAEAVANPFWWCPCPRAGQTACAAQLRGATARHTLIRSTIQVYLAVAISFINSSSLSPSEHQPAILQYLTKFHTLQTDSLPKSQTKQRQILQWLILPDTLTPYFPLETNTQHTSSDTLLQTIELIDSGALDQPTNLTPASTLKKFADVVPFDQTYFKK